MKSAPDDALYYDYYDVDSATDIHSLFRRMRTEDPLYYNERHDFYALSRHEDIEQALVDRDAYVSGKGVTLEFIKSGIDMPPGTVIFEDPPAHTIHRALLSRMFTPKNVSALEPEIRAYCASTLDPFVGNAGLDFVADIGLQVPMRVIGMLLGVPWDDHELVRDHFAAAAEQGVDHQAGTHGLFNNEVLAAYVDWRIEHPADDVITELLRAEFEDETGTTRRLSRGELLMYINILAAAGNETTGRLIGWAGKLLSDHPDARKDLVEHRALIPGAVEEILRYESPALQTCRYVASDVEVYGRRVPTGSAMLLLLSSGNRDERRYDEPDRFDIRRKAPHLSFAFGPHFCLGASLARLEARVVLEEVLARFPDWEVDEARATLTVTPAFRGWESLPVSIP